MIGSAGDVAEACEIVKVHLYDSVRYAEEGAEWEK